MKAEEKSPLTVANIVVRSWPFRFVIGIGAIVIALMVAYVYFLPSILSADTIRSYSSLVDSASLVAAVIGCIGIAGAIITFLDEHKFDRSMAMTSAATILVYVMFLGGGSVHVPWSAHTGGQRTAAVVVRYSEWSSVKLQVDTCNIKSINYVKYSPSGPWDAKNAYLAIALHRQAPDTDKNGRQVAVVSSMNMGVDARDNVLHEIDQLKPSCPQNIPLIMKNPFN